MEGRNTPATGIFELAAITGGTGRVQSDDVLALVDVHDATQAAQGSLIKITVAQLYRTEATPVTVSTPLPDIAQTWNAGGVTFTAVRLNVADTASAAGSLLLDLQVGGVSKVSVRKDGALTVANGLTVSAGTTAVQAVSATTCVVGTDPGGSELLRVGGSLRIDTITNDNVRTNLDLISTGAVGVIRFYTQNTLRATIGSAGGLTVASGGASITGGLTVATGDVVATAGNFKLNAAVSKIVPGATSLSLRNNADSADNLLITDAGAVTFRSTVGGITTLTATTLGGTLSTAAQPNITSVGILASPHLTSPVVDSGGLTVTAGGVAVTGGAVTDKVKSLSGSLIVTTSVATTLFAASYAAGTYLVSTTVSGGGIGFAIVTQSDTNNVMLVQIQWQSAAGAAAISVSGLNVQVTTNTAGNPTVTWSATRLA